VNSIADENHAGEDFETYYRTLIKTEASVFDFSPALKAKFERAAHRLINVELDRRAAKNLKTAQKVAKAVKAGTDVEFNIAGGHLFKSGRWTYPVAEGATTGRLYRNAKTDGSGEWIRVEDASKIIDA